jgi:hypothetical protein
MLDGNIFYPWKPVKQYFLLTECFHFGILPSMKLKPYLEKMGIDRKAFSEQSGIPLPTVYRLTDEPERIPDGNTIARVVKATGGAVGLFDLVEDTNGKAASNG